jgi:hypothetical protein
VPAPPSNWCRNMIGSMSNHEDDHPGMCLGPVLQFDTVMVMPGLVPVTPPA